MPSPSELGQLVPRGGGDPIPLLKPKLLIGRREMCDIVLEYPNISSKHCELELKDGYWMIRDLRSRNGVRVNGERVESKYVMPGDEIGLAKHHFCLEYQPSTTAAPPVETNPFSMGLLEKAGLQAEEERRRRIVMPPAAKKLPPTPQKGKFTRDEDEAAAWLMDDE